MFELLLPEPIIRLITKVISIIFFRSFLNRKIKLPKIIKYYFETKNNIVKKF